MTGVAVVLSLLLACGACAKQPPDLLIRTPFGPIPIVLDRSESLDATGKLLDLAARHSSGGEFIRAEARPAGNPAIPGGGPYALLQGTFDGDEMSLPKTGTKTTIRPGDVVLIPSTNAFYIALDSHDGWCLGTRDALGRPAGQGTCVP